MKKQLLYLILSFCLLASSASAGELSILINGKAIHFDTPSGLTLNESNWGAGLQYDWDRNGRKWVPFVVVSGFIDSVNSPSYYAGGGYMQRWQLNKTWHADAGWIGFLMARQDFNNGDLFPGVLPAFSIGTNRVSLNATYIPKVYPKMVALAFFQLKIKLADY